MSKKTNWQVIVEELKEENATLKEENATSKEEAASLRTQIEELKAESRAASSEGSGTTFSVDEQVEGLTQERNGLREKAARYREECQVTKKRYDEDITRAMETARMQTELLAMAVSREKELERKVDQLQGALLKVIESAARSTSTGMALEEGGPTLSREEEIPVEESTPSEKGARPDKITTSATTTSHLTDQVPLLAPFRGDPKEEDEDSFTDWIEQFEELAEWHSWGDTARLRQLRMRLQGPARVYCRSRPQKEQESYEALKEVLKERYMPVHIQSVQSALYYELKQGTAEPVDSYAQDLWKLFRKAYPKIAAEGGEEAERSLTSKFLSGLWPQLQKKLAGAEGTLDQLVARAHFEETTHKEIQVKEGHKSFDRPRGGGRNKKPDFRRDKAPKDLSKECYNCGGAGIAGQEMTLQILLQDEAPQELLIGTNVLSQLRWTFGARWRKSHREASSETDQGHKDST